MANNVDNKASKPEEEDEKNESLCFPCQPCVCCPPPLLSCIPDTWQKIQDSTHFMLVVGLFSCILLIIHGVVYIYNGFSLTNFSPKLDDLRSIAAILFAFPLTIYCSRVIGQYDERLQRKQKLAKQEKEKLLGCYQGLLADMDGLLSKSTESASGLAERSFESKRRDFQRFLDRARARFSSTGVESEEMIHQFRRFCMNWLNVFKECSIDPVDMPKLIVDEAELVACTSIEEIATKISERLQTTEIRFITEQRKNDTNNLNQKKQKFQDMAHNKKGKQLALTDGASRRNSESGRRESFNASSFAGAPGTSFLGQTTQKPGQISWIKCENVGCKCPPAAANATEGCPRDFMCGCFLLKVLSKQHLSLIGSFFLGCSVMGLSAYLYLGLAEESPQRTHEIVVLTFMTFSILSLVVILLKFEQLDVVQRLEREIQDLQAQNAQVEEQQKKMREFWNQAQQLTELWLYRTVPRLDLVKELHSQLEDAQDEGDLLTYMTGANNGLEEIDRRLGSLENWRGDGLLKVEDKKAFGKIINELCQEQDPEIAMAKLQDVVKSREMAALMN